MSSTPAPQMIFNSPSALLPGRLLVTHTAVQLGVEVVGHVLTDWRAERDHGRQLRERRQEDGLRSQDLDRLERVAAVPDVAPEQKAAALDLMLDLIAQRHELPRVRSVREA